MHLRCCPDTSIFEEQVGSVSDMDQIVNPTNLSGHRIQTCNLAGQILFLEIFL